MYNNNNAVVPILMAWVAQNKTMKEAWEMLGKRNSVKDISTSEGGNLWLQSTDWQSAGHPEELERQSRSVSYRDLDIASQGQIRIGAKGIDNNIPQSTIGVDGGLVYFLASFWELITVDIQLDLSRELVAGQRLQTRNAISAGVVSRLV